MCSALKFLTRYAQEGEEFLDSIVTGDETWVFHRTPESKQQSLQYAFPENQKIKNFNFNEKNHGVRFLGQKRHSHGLLHAFWHNN